MKNITVIRSAVPFSRKFVGALILSLIFVLTGGAALAPAHAANYTYDGEQRAHNVLDNRDNATTILGYLHFGAKYNGHKLIRESGVQDGNGYLIDGEFALIYRFYWEDDGVTDVAFLCHPNGQIYQSNIVYTNAILSQPFALANGAIQLLGNALIESDKDNMTQADYRLARQLIDNVDAHGLMDLWLRLE